MTTIPQRTRSGAIRHPRHARPGMTVIPALVPDHETAVAGTDLLAHWWSRPTAAEVQEWLDRRPVAERLFGRVTPPPAPDRADAPSLLREYERLFVGPGPVPCPPYESYWRLDVPLDLRGSLMGPCTAELRLLYARLGLELSPRTREFTDYLPIELEALAYALRRPDASDIAGSIVVDHLSTWVQPFAQAVNAAARHRFYRDVARITAGWVLALDRHLGETEPGGANG